MTQLRCGTLKLKIELGRFRRPPIPSEERICEMCPSAQVEDEKHFLFNCNLYDTIREPWYENINKDNAEFTMYNDNEKLKYIMGFHQISTANFICNAYELRKSKLYK